MLSILVTLVVVCLIVGLLWYVLDAIPVPDPLNRFAKIASVVIGCLIVVFLLLDVAGYNTGVPRLR